MKNYQFDDFCTEVKKQHNSNGLDGSYTLHVTSGKFKGKNLPLERISGRYIVLRVDEESTVTVPYANCERVGSDGLPIYAPVIDMTGRVIEIGNFITYSVSAGQNSHAMEIGRVVSFTNTGMIKVDVMVHNGDVVTVSSWRRSKERTVNDHRRSMLLPVDPTTMMMWIMTDFDMKNQE